MSLTTLPTPNDIRTPPSVIATIIAVSAIASAFLCWLVYYHTPIDAAREHLSTLPLFNSILNALSALALIEGYRHIRARRIKLHRASMFGAFFFSSIFLVSYITNHALHGNTLFNRLNPWWPFYSKLLLSHILLSILVLPMILITFFLSLTGRFPAHKRLARYTFPIWLYVSVTGVIVYILQATIH